MPELIVTDVINSLLEGGISFNLFIEDYRNAILTQFFLFLHYFGSAYGYMFVLPIVCLKWPKLAKTLILFALISWAVNRGLKDFFALPRPFVGGKTNPILFHSSYSFPSGHAQAAAMFWGFLALSSGSRIFKNLAVFLIITIGFSRVYLGVHYYTDVVAGWTIGLIFAFLALSFYQRTQKIVAT